MIVTHLLEPLFVIVGILIRVAFITLFERKILGYIQIRKGPNKVGIIGILQPIRDAIKLFIKENTNITSYNVITYAICPIASLFLMLLVFCSTPWIGHLVDFSYAILFLFCILGLSVYPIFGAGWASNSKYPLLGALRAIAQTISYEVVFSLILLTLLMFLGAYDFFNFVNYTATFLIFPHILVMWLICALRELNRTPYDFAEGERELVSGFNVEYSSFAFALIFIAEYGFIIFISYISVLIFINTSLVITQWTLLVTFFLALRGAFPRFRYDKLIYIAWKSLLPTTLNLICFTTSITLLLIISF